MGTPGTNTHPLLAEASEQVAGDTKSHNVLKIPGPKHLAFVLGECEEGRRELARLHSMDPDLPAPRGQTLRSQGVHRLGKRKRKGREQRREGWGGGDNTGKEERTGKILGSL